MTCMKSASSAMPSSAAAASTSCPLKMLSYQASMFFWIGKYCTCHGQCCTNGTPPSPTPRETPRSATTCPGPPCQTRQSDCGPELRCPDRVKIGEHDDMPSPNRLLRLAHLEVPHSKPVGEASLKPFNHRCSRAVVYTTVTCCIVVRSTCTSRSSQVEKYSVAFLGRCRVSRVAELHPCVGLVSSLTVSRQRQVRLGAIAPQMGFVTTAASTLRIPKSNVVFGQTRQGGRFRLVSPTARFRLLCKRCM